MLHMKSKQTVCEQLVELHRQRQDLHRAEKALTLRIKAKCRSVIGRAGPQPEETDKQFLARVLREADILYRAMMGTKEHVRAAEMFALCEPFFQARGLIEAQRKTTEKEMVAEARHLPVTSWVDTVHGFGLLGLASIIGETGDLSNYPTVAKLWKRLGLAVINGERQQRKPGVEAYEHGYCPSRRSVVWTIGDSLFRANGPYADLCRQRKELERQKAEAQGLIVCPAAKIPANDKDHYRSDGHIHNRAKRWMEKELIKHLWRAWRDCEV